MKYEITKGTKDEFELAPEWATLVVAGRHYSKAWISHYANGARALAFGTKDEYVIEAIHDCEIISERRPITEPVWSGEGLPPVGVECEGLFPRHPGNSFEWQDCLVLYVFEHECAVKSKGTSTLHYCDQFRPIRSPEDVARDDFIKKLSGNVIEGFSIGTKFAAALYDAGYRKME